MVDQVEKVARAIYAEQGTGRSFESIRHTSMGNQIFRYARAAITAYNPNERLREALEPFALAADDLDDKHGDHSSIWEASAAMSITAGQLRKAREVFAALTPPSDLSE